MPSLSEHSLGFVTGRTVHHPTSSPYGRFAERRGRGGGVCSLPRDLDHNYNLYLVVDPARPMLPYQSSASLLRWNAKTGILSEAVALIQDNGHASDFSENRSPWITCS
jgi:hypothetical protein